MAAARTPLRLGAVLLLAAVVFAAPTLLVPGSALILIGGGVSAWIALAGAGSRVRRVGLRTRVGEGEEFELTHVIEAGRLPLRGELVDPVLEEPVPLRWLRPGRTAELRSRGRFERRGRQRLPAPAIRISDPLGIGSRSIGGGPGTAVLVLPRVEPVRFAPAEGAAARRSRASAGELTDAGMRETAADPELEGLRPYRPGTRASRIYWPALARGEELLERHLSPAADSGSLVILDTRDAASADALERAVRAAASIVAHLGGRGGCELLIGGDHHRHRVGGDPGSLLAARSALALVEGREGAPRARRFAPSRALIWITAGGSAPPFTRRMEGVLISAEPLPARERLLEVAGCSGYALAGTGARGGPVEAVR